jgi:hypothetical protein
MGTLNSVLIRVRRREVIVKGKQRIIVYQSESMVG